MTDYFPNCWIALDVNDDLSMLEIVGGAAECRVLDLTQLGAVCSQLALELPSWRSGPHATGRVPLAVFVRLSSFFAVPNVLPRLRHELGRAVDPDCFELVYLPQSDESRPVNHSNFRCGC